MAVCELATFLAAANGVCIYNLLHQGGIKHAICWRSQNCNWLFRSWCICSVSFVFLVARSALCHVHGLKQGVVGLELNHVCVYWKVFLTVYHLRDPILCKEGITKIGIERLELHEIFLFGHRHSVSPLSRVSFWNYVCDRLIKPIVCHSPFAIFHVYWLGQVANLFSLTFDLATDAAFERRQSFASGSISNSLGNALLGIAPVLALLLAV